MEPVQGIIYFGMRFQTVLNRVCPRDLDSDRFHSGQGVLVSDLPTCTAWLRLLGLRNAAADLLHLERLRLCTLQMALLSHWWPAVGRTDNLGSCLRTGQATLADMVQ